MNGKISKSLLVLLIAAGLVVLGLLIAYLFRPTIHLLLSPASYPQQSSISDKKIVLLDESEQIDIYLSESRSVDHLESFLPLTNNSISYSKLNIIITDTPQPFEQAWLAADGSPEIYVSSGIETKPTGEIDFRVHFNKPVLEKYNWSADSRNNLLQQLVLQALISLQNNNSFDSAQQASITKNQELFNNNIMSPFIVVYEE